MINLQSQNNPSYYDAKLNFSKQSQDNDILFIDNISSKYTPQHPYPANDYKIFSSEFEMILRNLYRQGEYLYFINDNAIMCMNTIHTLEYLIKKLNRMYNNIFYIFFSIEIQLGVEYILLLVIVMRLVVY